MEFTRIINGVTFDRLASVSGLNLLANPLGSIGPVAGISLGAGLQLVGGTLSTSGSIGTVGFSQLPTLSGYALIGNPTGVPGTPQNIYLGSGFAMSGNTLQGTSVTFGSGITGASANGTAVSVFIDNNALGYNQISQVSGLRLLGNPTASLANVTEISVGTGLVLAGGALATTGLAPANASYFTFAGETGLNGERQLTFSTEFTPTDLGANSTYQVNLATNGVQYTRVRQVSGFRILGNPTSSLSNLTEITLGTGLIFWSGALHVSGISGGGGGLTSVGIATQSSPVFTVSGSPLTGNGTITLVSTIQNSGFFYAAPTGTSTSGYPIFRAIATSDVPTGLIIGTIGCSFGNGLLMSATGTKIGAVVPYNGTIIGYTVLSDVSGIGTINVLKASYAQYPVVTGIAGTGIKIDLPLNTLKNTDSVLSTWSPSINAGDYVQFVLQSTSGSKRLQAFLTVNRS